MQDTKYYTITDNYDAYTIYVEPFDVVRYIAFTTINKIHKFFEDTHFIRNNCIIKDKNSNRECYLVEIIPNGFSPAKFTSNLYITSSFTFGEKYSLYDIDTYTKLGISKVKIDFIDKTTLTANIKTLQMILDHATSNTNEKNLHYTKNVYMFHIAEVATINGLTDILQWILSTASKHWTYTRLIYLASIHGHVSVLDIISQLTTKIKCHKNIINIASSNGHHNVLEWWMNSRLELKYTKNAIDNASQNGHTSVLNWWINSGLELKYTRDAIRFLNDDTRDEIIQWWRDSGLRIDRAYINN